MSPARNNVRTASFRDLFDQLPITIRQLAEEAFHAFEVNPDHPALRRHRLKDNDRGRHRQGSFSVSITLKYRALYFEDAQTNVWYWIGSHADYDTFTGV